MYVRSFVEGGYRITWILINLWLSSDRHNKINRNRFPEYLNNEYHDPYFSYWQVLFFICLITSRTWNDKKNLKINKNSCIQYSSSLGNNWWYWSIHRKGHKDSRLYSLELCQKVASLAVTYRTHFGNYVENLHKCLLPCFTLEPLDNRVYTQ